MCSREYTKFRLWLENNVLFSNIQNAIQQTLGLVLTNGTWEFEQKYHGVSQLKTVGISGHFRCSKGHFFVVAHVLAGNPIQSYDALTGQIDQNTKIEIMSSVYVVTGTNSLGGRNLKKLDTDRTHTPYQFSKWVKTIIDDYGTDDDDDNDYEAPMPSSPSVLVGV